MLKRFVIILVAAGMILPALAGRPKIGLALGGGGAKGAAEVGVLKVLEEAGIRVDCIAGASIGAIVGGLYAAGYSATELDSLFQTQEWFSLLTDRKASLSNEPYKTVDGVTYIFGFPVIDKNMIDRNSRGFGIMRGSRIEQILDSMVSVRGCTDFESLRIPFRCVAADIRTAEEVIISEGLVCKGLRASMAIPGIFKPVPQDDYLLVDGGMLNNLPVDICREMGADIVIAVDLNQGDPQPRQKIDVSSLSGLASILGLGGVVEWVANRPDINKYNQNRKDADIYIAPSLPDYDTTSFGNKNAARMIEAGVSAAKTHWDELQKLTSEKLQVGASTGMDERVR